MQLQQQPTTTCCRPRKLPTRRSREAESAVHLVGRAQLADIANSVDYPSDANW